MRIQKEIKRLRKQNKRSDEKLKHQHISMRRERRGFGEG